MTEELDDLEPTRGRWIPFAAAFVALLGLLDAGYLTNQHYTEAPVPCSLVAGCETVLTSAYAQLYGIPTAAYGAFAYFIAFALAILAAYGNRLMWKLFGVQVVIMALVTCWLIYLQAFVIGAFCQFCLLSALTTFSLLILFIISKVTRATD
jgi:uncharacterized membrane protein